MPLINCPECKSEISDTSLKCKDCGFPIKATLKDKNLKSIGNSTNQIIPKKWQIHVVISAALSLFAMVIAANESGYNSYEEEGIISFLCTAFAYWIILSIIVRIKSYNNRVKSVTKRFISKAWLRLHIVLSIIGGCLLMIFYSIIVGMWDIDDCGSVITWPLFYWLCILILWEISKFNNGIISKRWLTGHTIINLCISIILIIYVFNIEYYSNYSGELRREFDDGEAMFMGQLSFFLYYLILFIAVWLINGFKQDDA